MPLSILCAKAKNKELYVKTKVNDRTFTHKDTNLYIERLYVDYTLNENYMIRVGKFNSPIGYWNLVPINVLRDTSSHPITSDILFPEFTTGALATFSHYDTGEIKVDVTLQNNTDLDECMTIKELRQATRNLIEYGWNIDELALLSYI